jgi:hypothetical protein
MLSNALAVMGIEGETRTSAERSYDEVNIVRVMQRTSSCHSACAHLHYEQQQKEQKMRIKRSF